MSDLTARLAAIRERMEAARKGDWHSGVMTLAESQADVLPLLGAVEAVLEVHKPIYASIYNNDACLECLDSVGDQVEWPCPTVRTITKHLGVDDEQ